MVLTVSRRAALMGGIAILIAGLVGAYRGFQGAMTEADVAAASEGLAPTASSLSARQAAPLAEPPAPTLTEEQIRAIARQEAQSALARAQPAEPAPEPSAPAAPAAPTPPPTASRPLQPAPSEASQPPLF
jgi:hypothetical protein